MRSLADSGPTKPALASAIRDRAVVHLRYDWGQRVVEPHVYGLSQDGHELLRAFQTGGDSETNAFGWKLFRVDEIQGLHATGERFKRPRRGYNRKDPAITRKVFAKL